MSFDLETSVQGAGMGAQTGGKIAGPWGAVGGAIVGGIYGGLVGGKHKKEDKRLKRLQDMYFGEMMKLVERFKQMGGDQWDEYKDYFQPVEELIGKQALSGNFAAPENIRQQYMSRASADVTNAFEKVRKQSDRRMIQNGIDPASGMSMALQQKMGVEQGLAESAAVTQGARQADEDVYNRRMKAVDVGGNIFNRGQNLLEGAYAGYGNAYNIMGQKRGQNAQELKDKMSILGGSGMPSAGAFMPGGGGGGMGGMIPANAGATQPGGWQVGSGMLGGGVKDGGPVGTFNDGGMSQPYQQGGAVEGPGGPVDDKVGANVPAGSYVIPADVVEALGVDYFDKLLQSLGGMPGGAEGMHGRISARLSSGEYVIPAAVVERKGRKFFDSLVEKYHKPAKDQSDEYQKKNAGAQPGEAMHTFEPHAADGAAFMQPGGDAMAPVPGAPGNPAAGTSFSYTPQMTGMPDQEPINYGYNAPKTQKGPDTVGWQDYLKMRGRGDVSYGGAKEMRDRYAKLKPQPVGTFTAAPSLYDPNNRIDAWKARRAQQLGEKQYELDKAAYENPNFAPLQGPSQVGDERTPDLSRADGGTIASKQAYDAYCINQQTNGLPCVSFEQFKAGARADGGPVSPEKEIKTPDNAQPTRIKAEVDKIADKYKKKKDEEKDERGNVQKLLGIGGPRISLGNKKADGGPMGGMEGPMAKDGGKVEKVMHEYKHGQLHSGSKSGPQVTDRKQAVAIALSEARKAGEHVKDGGKVKRKKTRRGRGRRHSK